ncbi:TerC family protein [Dickeya fangzhongdai]|uniref:TerC family protein n=1 Tax=Dickeya fangzhongdai TaxID=1778540 RepID=UPI0004F8C26E|nr:TerC family protein [Dickeya fangzhongdai]AIR70680.1 membrane protein [Dickeya fangzhongdai]KGT99904.1 membrane protein [Dickeya fangzhongdai]
MLMWLADPNAWLTLFTLTLLEIILGIDNIIFLSLVVARLPHAQQSRARFTGLAGAMLMRLSLLASIAWLMHLTDPLFSIADRAFSARDLILLTGGLFLIVKSGGEIRAMLAGEEEAQRRSRTTAFWGAIVQIMLLDIIFSLDSVITAVGLSQHLLIMMLAVVLGVVIMMLAARTIGEFIDAHPSVKMLALAFLILVGGTLMLDSLQIHVPKGYVYFAMFFTIGVEILNLARQHKHHPALETRLSEQ